MSKIIVGVGVLAGAGAGAGWYMASHSAKPTPEVAEEHAEHTAEQSTHTTGAPHGHEPAGEHEVKKAETHEAHEFLDDPSKHEVSHAASDSHEAHGASSSHDEKPHVVSGKEMLKGSHKVHAESHETHEIQVEPVAHHAVPQAVKKRGWFANLFSPFMDAYESAQEKMDRLSKADQENTKLALENANLRFQLESLKLAGGEKGAKHETEEKGFKINQETGAKIGRTLASISYKPPAHLLPDQLYALGVSYFKAREDEKAAVIFTVLTNLEEVQTYKNPQNFLLTGVAWYRVDNFELANLYFDWALKSPEKDENLKLQAQARLWKGLSAERSKNHAESQHWLKDLLDHHPHAMESEWVNEVDQSERKSYKEVKRAPTSVHSPQH